MRNNCGRIDAISVVAPRVPGAPRKAAWVARALRRMQKSLLIVIWLFGLVATCYLLVL